MIALGFHFYLISLLHKSRFHEVCRKVQIAKNDQF